LVAIAALAASALLLSGAPLASAETSAQVTTAPAGPSEHGSSASPYWVAAHTATTLWADPTPRASEVGSVSQWTLLQAVPPQHEARLLVWSPPLERYVWIDAAAVGPVDPSLAGTALLPPIDGRPLWAGHATVTMYTCAELGGCNYTASGIWPEPGVVAVDPNVIPLGSKVWVQGLGTFIAADTGSLVRGTHIDVFGTSYWDALQWGVQYLPIVVFE
jgi:3D (Asp-Asp-Asp) domain-containing protein